MQLFVEDTQHQKRRDQIGDHNASNNCGEVFPEGHSVELQAQQGSFGGRHLNMSPNFELADEVDALFTVDSSMAVMPTTENTDNITLNLTDFLDEYGPHLEDGSDVQTTLTTTTGLTALDTPPGSQAFLSTTPTSANDTTFSQPADIESAALGSDPGAPHHQADSAASAVAGGEVEMLLHSTMALNHLAARQPAARSQAAAAASTSSKNSHNHGGQRSRTCLQTDTFPSFSCASSASFQAALQPSSLLRSPTPCSDLGLNANTCAASKAPRSPSANNGSAPSESMAPLENRTITYVDATRSDGTVTSPSASCSNIDVSSASSNEHCEDDGQDVPGTSSKRAYQSSPESSVGRATPPPKTPKRRDGGWQRTRRAMKKALGAGAVLDTSGIGRSFGVGVSAILKELSDIGLSELRCRFASLEDFANLYESIMELPAPEKSCDGPNSCWQQVYMSLRQKEANIRLCRGMYFVVLARHMQKQLGTAPSLDAIHKRLREVVRGEDTLSLSLDTVRCHYYFALAVLRYPGLAALSVGYRKIAHAWCGTLKIRRLRCEHSGAAGLANLPLPLDEEEGFKETMEKIIADQNGGLALLKLANENTEPSTCDEECAMQGLVLGRRDLAGVGPDGQFSQEIAARMTAMINIPELSQGLSTIGDGLQVKPSTISEAGLGLFATRPFQAEELITFYQGQLISHQQAQVRMARGKGAYLATLVRMHEVVDGMRASDMKNGCGGASACNDASDGSGIKNNAYFVVRRMPGRLLLRARHDIAEGDEIFCSYGRTYWREGTSPAPEEGEADLDGKHASDLADADRD
jgi:hypothetical protein